MSLGDGIAGFFSGVFPSARSKLAFLLVASIIGWVLIDSMALVRNSRINGKIEHLERLHKLGLDSGLVASGYVDDLADEMLDNRTATQRIIAWIHSFGVANHPLEESNVGVESNKGKGPSGSQLRFLSGGILWWLLAILMLFIDTSDNLRNRVFISILVVVLSFVMVFLFSFIPVLWDGWLNVIINLVVSFAVGFYMYKVGDKKNKKKAGSAN